jgi:glyoxylase-like metal-dependent hydrolase (beta-lactamase superfamily II)
MQLPAEIPAVYPDRWLNEGDLVPLGSHEFLVMHLPGHDPGHIALYSEPDRLLLSGDVLFPNGHGRIDIPGASQEEMAASLKRLTALPGDVVVYPGHGLPTTIGAESWLQGFKG